MQKLENIEAIAFIIIFTLNGITLSTGKFLISECSSSSLINVIYISILALLITVAFCLLTRKFRGKDLLEISTFLGGKPLKFIIGLIFICYFTFRGIIFLKRICNCMQIVYFPMTDLVFILALFCLAIAIASSMKNNGVIKSAVIIFPIIFVATILIFIGNCKNFNFENIYPIFGNGIKTTFLCGISNIFAFSGLSYILFIPSKLKNPKKFTKISIISIILSSIFLLFSIANVLFLFSGTITNSELFPSYIAVRYIEFGTFFQRLDSLFLFLCALSVVCALSINTYLVIDIIKDLLSLSDRKPIIYPYILIFYSLALLIAKTSTLEFLENTVYKIVFLSVSIIMPTIILVISNIKLKIKGDFS